MTRLIQASSGRSGSSSIWRPSAAPRSDREPVHALGSSLAERPTTRARARGCAPGAGAACHGGDEAALNGHGDEHDDHDDPVHSSGLGIPSRRSTAEQDRYRAFEAGEQDEAVRSAQPCRDQARSDKHRSDHHGEHRPRSADRESRRRSGEFAEVDGEAEHDERDDLAEAGQRGVEPFDLALVRARGRHRAGFQRRRPPEIRNHAPASRPRTAQPPGKGAKWVQSLAGSGRCA